MRFSSHSPTHGFIFALQSNPGAVWPSKWLMLSSCCQCLSLQSVRLRFRGRRGPFLWEQIQVSPGHPCSDFPFSFCLISSGLKNSVIFYLLKVRDRALLGVTISEPEGPESLSPTFWFSRDGNWAQLVLGKARSRTLVQLNSKCPGRLTVPPWRHQSWLVLCSHFPDEEIKV